jgi:RNA polymerase sigma factor (sigma-70 family)
VSLDVPVGPERDGTELGDLVPDAALRPADDALADKEIHDEAHALLATLPEREAEVLRLRFGVGGGAGRTLEEVGARMSLSRERARQLEREALRKLRVASERRRTRVQLDR